MNLRLYRIVYGLWWPFWFRICYFIQCDNILEQWMLLKRQLTWNVNGPNKHGENPSVCLVLLSRSSNWCEMLTAPINTWKIRLYVFRFCYCDHLLLQHTKMYLLLSIKQQFVYFDLKQTRRETSQWNFLFAKNKRVRSLFCHSGIIKIVICVLVDFSIYLWLMAGKALSNLQHASLYISIFIAV